MKDTFPVQDSPLSLEELEAYAVADPAAPAATPMDVAAPGPAAVAADAPLTAEELAAYAEVPTEATAAAPVVEAAVPTPGRVNMVGPQGEPVDVAPEDVERVYGLGYRLDASEVAGEKTVPLIEDDGSVKVYAREQRFPSSWDTGPSELDKRLAAGARIATPAEVAQEFGDAGSTAGAGVEGLLQGATLGGYGLAADSLGGADYRAERQLREMGSPIVSTVANIAGAAAPALLSGGTSTGVSGAGLAARAAALTPAARLASLGGRMAEALSVRATGAGLGAAGRIGAGALAAGAEGAIDNVARVVADDLAAGDVEITAERMLDAAWDGAKYSAILGGGASAVGEGLGRLRAGREARALAGAADDVAPVPVGAVDDAVPAVPVRAADEVSADLDAARQQIADAEAVGDNALGHDAEERIAALIREQDEAGVAREGLTSDADIEATLKIAPTPEAQGILDKLDANLNAAKNARDLDFKFQDATDDLAVKMEGKLDAWSRFRTNFLDIFSNRSNKPKVVRAQLAKDGVQWTPENASKLLTRVEKMESTLDEMGDINRHAIYSKEQLRDFKAGKDSLQKLKKHLTNLSGAGPISPDARVIRGSIDDVAETFTGLDFFKSHLGTFAAQMDGRPATTAEATFQRLYMLLRADLQDPRIFGKSLADFQTASNAAITRAIRKSGNFKAGFARAGTSESGGQYGFAPVMEFDAKKLKSWLAGGADPTNHKMDRDFFAGLTSQVELAETLSKYYPMPPKALEEIAQMRATLEEMKGLAAANKQLSLKASNAKRLAAQTNSIQDVVNGVRALGATGGAIATVAGTATAVARGLAGAVVALGKGAVKQEQAIDKVARKTVTTLIEGKPPTSLPAPAATKDVPRHMRGLGITANAMRRAVEDSQALVDPNSGEYAALQAQVQDVARESPELAQALEQKVMAKAEFIASKIPPSTDSSDPFQARPSLVDPVTERTVAKYVDAAQNPVRALERMSRGEGTKEDKEVMQALYPRLYERYVAQVMQHVGEMKKPPTREQRQKLHFATGVPMSREQQPSYVAKRQEVAAQAGNVTQEERNNEGMKPVTPPGKVDTEFEADKHFASRSDAVMGGADD